MIPLRLTVKNFMCYRDEVPILDLEPIHVACLCGANGHGKTALLDAMTWALWGSARARTQEELVHQGQTDMAVELDFSARGQRYRVSRRHSRSVRSRQGSSILELQVSSGNGYRPITGNSMRETQDRISSLLHMDYETFVNTAFLRQGDADRFTTATPTKRKETLAEVLDLSYYDGLEERARARSRDRRDRVRDLESAAAVRQQEISGKAEREEQLVSVSAELARLGPETELLQNEIGELRGRADSLRARRTELEELSRRIADAGRDVAELERRVPVLQARIRQYEEALAREDQIRKQHAALEEARRELDRLGQALGRKSELDSGKAGLEREIAVQRERRSGEVGQLRQRIAVELEPRAKRLPEIEAGLQALELDRTKLAQDEEALRKLRQRSQETAARLRYLDDRNAGLLHEMEDTRKKFDMLEQGDKLCPVCKQPLGPEGQDHLRREYESQGRETRRQYNANRQEHTTLAGEHERLESQVSQSESQLAELRRRTEAQAAGLERDRADSEVALTGLDGAKTSLAEAEALIRSEEFALEERSALKAIEAEVSALAYDPVRHAQVREQVTSLERYDILHGQLEEAAERLPTEREAHETARQMLERRRQETNADRERKAAAEDSLKALPALESRLHEAEVRHLVLGKRMDEARVGRRVLEREIARIGGLESEVRGLEKERRAAADDRGIYDELAVAFGKNGIQALIIETAIPQLEEDANQLLGRLTDNRMFLRLQLAEGRKDGRTGLSTEELDIKIADEVGTRSYETFSGGETFRINFALRIALSKLLARRSGAPLSILFIDEGFGSQDAAGQERLTEAIQSIQDDFEKIIVITHIDQIREAFPVRIEVTKTGMGSTFSVV
jgi:exonuclease SbcC